MIENMKVRRFKEEDAQEVRNLIVRNFLEVNSKDYGISAMEKLAKAYNAEKVLNVASYAHMYVFEFDGKITKKRQPKNIIIVTTFKRELYRVKTVSSREDALAYMGDLVSKIMAVMDEFRGVQLLFNILNEEDYASFEVFKKLEFQKIIPKLEIVLFNPEIGEIKEKNRVGE